MKIYRIRHKETGGFWYTRSRKVWESIGAAKGAFSKTECRTFDRQDKYEIVEYALVEKEKHEDLKMTQKKWDNYLENAFWRP